MCGRYRLSTKGKTLEELFGAELDAESPGSWPVKPRFNVAPTDLMPVVRVADDGRRHISGLRWGLVPFWSKDLSAGARMINARSETVLEKAAFKDCLRRRRCLVLADGFYEWKTLAGPPDGPRGGKKKPSKQPMLFAFDDDHPFAMAGLWARWKGPVEPEGAAVVVETFTILTAPANELVGPVHDRMPLILDPADHAEWLDPSNEHVDVARLAEPHTIERFTMRLVSSKVGNVKNDDESILIPDDAAQVVLPLGEPRKKTSSD
ncbi:MAG: SOS response-associated peptidase [Deltaproteobacteria bacterium]|nr:SOS response-associated peptidase [Deltaproteobacteria bacterium]